jgi:D-3-phosphoglycerate dehydrogenase
MKIVIPDDYQDMVDRLDCFSLIRHHDVTRYREPARDLAQLVERLDEAEVVVSIRERVEFSRALLQQLPKLKLIALVGRNSQAIDFAACTELGIPVSTGKSNSPVAPAELTLALIVASRRNVALEAERMKRGDWPCTLSHRLRGSTIGIFGLGAIGALVAEAGSRSAIRSDTAALASRSQTSQRRSNEGAGSCAQSDETIGPRLMTQIPASTSHRQRNAVRRPHRWSTCAGGKVSVMAER